MAAPLKILIVGPHRSGTSAIAGTVEALGVDLGRPERGWPTYPSNPKGQFEHPAFVATLDKIVGEWRCPQTHAHDPGLIEQFRRQYAALPAPCAIKDPRLCLAGQYLMDMTTHLIVVARVHKHVIRSLVTREPGAFDDSLAEYLTNIYRAGQLRIAGVAAQHAVPTCTVPYSAVCDRPEETVRAIARFLDLPVTETALAFPEPGLNHGT